MEPGAEEQGARLRVQRGHSGGSAAVLSTDGGLILTRDRHGVVAVWHADTGALLQRHTEVSSQHGSALFSPDSSRFLVVLWDGTVVVRSAVTGRIVHQHRAPRRSSWRHSATSPDGSRFLVTNSSGQIELRDSSTAAVQLAWTGRKPSFTPAAFSPGGERVVTAHGRGALAVWDSATGHRVLRLAMGRRQNTTRVAYSPDGDRILAAGYGFATVWDATSGERVASYRSPNGERNKIRISPIGDSAVEKRYPDLVHLDLDSGKELRRTRFDDGFIEDFVFSTDGSRVLVGVNHRKADSYVVYEWRTDSADPPREVGAPCSHANGGLSSVDWSRQIALVGCSDASVAVLDLNDGTIRSRLRSATEGLASVSESADGEKLRIIRSDSSAVQWDLVAGRVDHWTGGRVVDDRSWSDQLEQPWASFSPDGSKILTRWGRYGTAVRDAHTGESLFGVHSPGAWRSRPWWAAFSPDGSLVIAGDRDGVAVTRVASPRREEHTIRMPSGAAGGAISPDSTRLLVAPQRRRAAVRDLADLEPLFNLPATLSGFDLAAFSPSGDRIVTYGWSTASLVDAENGSLLVRLSGHAGDIRCAAFSQDGSRLVTASDDHTVATWESDTGRELLRLRGHTDGVTGAFFRSSSDHIVTSSRDGTVRIWNSEDGSLLLSLVAFDDRTWAVADPAGRFDASNDGDVSGMHWVIDNEPYDLAQLRDHYYDPGLLAKVMGYRDEPLREVPPLSAIVPPPRVHIEHPDEEGSTVALWLEERGGGTGELTASLNGSDISGDIATACPDLHTGARCVVDLATFPYFHPGEENELRAWASDAADRVQSRGAAVAYRAPRVQDADPPDLWAVVVGVGDYVGEAIDLRYPAVDAARMARALELAGARGFGEDRVHVTLLATDALGSEPILDTPAPTRANLDAAFAALGEGDPDDTLVVYLAGHGVARVDETVDDFFFLLPDAASLADVGDPALREIRTLSADTLADWMLRSPAKKRVLVLDTCSAGKAFESLMEPRNLSSDAIRAHTSARLRTGAWLLAGAAADQPSYEASRYGQGVLTYALLDGMKHGAALDEGDQLLVSLLFEHAEDRVPVFARGVGGVQQPLLRRGEGIFPLGELAEPDREAIPLAAERALVVRSSFQMEGRGDRLRLGPAVDRQLRARADAPDASLAYFDENTFPAAWQLVGSYRETEGGVAAEGWLERRVDDQLDEHRIEAEAADIDSLAAVLADRIEAHLRTL